MATILDRENTTVGTLNAVKSSSCNRSPSARRLCDITNVAQNVKSTLKDDNMFVFSAAEREIVEKLRKENATMLRAIAERDRIIEIRSLDVQKLKENLVKVTQQNWQLAQSNSQLLAELNIGKDKLKLQQHEFGIMSGMLKAKILELEGQVKKNMSDHSKRSSDSLKESELEKPKLPNQNQRRPSRIPSQMSSSTGQAVTRGCTDSKRRSSIIKREEPQETDQSKKTELISQSDLQVDDRMQQEDGSISLSSSPIDGIEPKCAVVETKVEEKVEAKEEKEESTMELNKPVEKKSPPRRSSMARPARRASQKIVSYKEMPLNTKLRRDN
ncbi:Shugoshin-1 [Nymphaea thermarum]|nr:Shugoshin-1 [Nymphaea thermarum]